MALLECDAKPHTLRHRRHQSMRETQKQTVNGSSSFLNPRWGFQSYLLTGSSSWIVVSDTGPGPLVHTGFIGYFILTLLLFYYYYEKYYYYSMFFSEEKKNKEYNYRNGNAKEHHTNRNGGSEILLKMIPLQCSIGIITFVYMFFMQTII